MSGRQFWRVGQTLLVIAVVAVAFAGLTSGPTVSPVPVALASAPSGNDNNDDDTNDDSEDRELRGQVVELYTDRNPPELVVAQVGGNITAKMLKTDEIARNGVKVGDHVRLQGEYNRGIFEATMIDVTDRCCPGPGDGDNDND